MKKSHISMKGLRTPRICLWISGFVHGRILHTGGLDPKTNTITSAYITGQLKRFESACIMRFADAEASLEKDWETAEHLLIDYENASFKLASTTDFTVFSGQSSSEEKRAKEHDAWNRAALVAEQIAIKKQLADISNHVSGQISQACSEMESTGDLLLGCLSAYGHGMLLKPIGPSLLPKIQLDSYRSRLLEEHQRIWNEMMTILKNTEEAER